MDKDNLIDWEPEIREPGHEIFSPNTWYGSAAILKRYSGWRLPLPLVVPHGVVLSSDFQWAAENQSGLPAVYCFPHYREKAYAAAGKLKVVLGASPWLYLLKMYPRTMRERRGTVAFPVHSTHHVKAQADDRSYAEYLRQLPTKLKPIKVCLFWRDLELGRHLPFIEKGLEVVTAGHMFSDKFLHRLYLIMSNCEVVLTPEVGSHVFYAASAGCRVVVQREFACEYVGDSATVPRDTPELKSEILDSLCKIFVNEADQKTQQALAMEMLGLQRVQSPLGLFATIMVHSFGRPAFLLKAFKHYRENCFTM